MARFRVTIWLPSTLALVLGAGGVGDAQAAKPPLAFSPAALQKQFALTPGLFKNAKFYSYQQILAQTLADKSPDAAEVHTYLSNPVQWQKNLMKTKTYELGLPRSRIILADGSIIRTYVRPQLPQGWQYHLFMDPPPKGFVQLTIYDINHLYLIQTPPNSQLLQQLQGKPQVGGQGKGVSPFQLQMLLPKL